MGDLDYNAQKEKFGDWECEEMLSDDFLKLSLKLQCKSEAKLAECNSTDFQAVFSEILRAVEAFRGPIISVLSEWLR